jgi:predicted DCC family thiol-disulfide oxidoreductase YuxK
MVKFLLKRDHQDQLRFASLQSEFSHAVLARHGLDADDLDTVCVVIDHGLPTERVSTRSNAIIEVLGTLGGVWRLMAIGRIVPRFLRDALYKLVVANRYRIYGKYDTCMLPEQRHRAKFLDLPG